MIIKAAMDWAIRNNVPPEVIAHMYTEPEYKYTDPVHGENERRVRGDLCLIVDPDGVILSVIPADKAQLPIEHVDGISIPKAKGGKGGNIYPTSFDEIISMLKDLGYSIEHSGSGHQSVYRDGALVYVLPNSASDYRALRNTITGLKKIGIELKRSA